MNIGKIYLTEIQFEKMWSLIHYELDLLYNNKKCSALIIYNNVYIICTSTSHKFVEDLYWKIGDFLYEILKANKHKIFESDRWISEYTIFYKKYLAFVKSINELADYLNQYITTKSIYNFAFLLWERCILQKCFKYKKINLGEHIIFHDNPEEIKICIESLKNIIVDPKMPLLYYSERYEKYAFSNIIDKCTDFVNKFKKDDIFEYLESVNIFIKNERVRRKNIFLKESWNKLDLIIEDILIVQKKKWIKNEIYKILIEHNLPVEILNTIRNSMTDNKKSFSLDDFIPGTRNGNAPQVKSNRINDFKKETNLQSNCKTISNFTKNEMTHFPLNDFYALFSSNIQNLYTYTTPALNQMKIITKHLSIVKFSSDILESVLLKFLTNQILSFNHLLDKNIETLYIFYTLFEHVVKVGFHNSKMYYLILKKKLKEVYNSLNPSLSTRLIKFSNLIISGDCVLEKKYVTLRKGFIDFYARSEICNFNEEEGIDYWGDNESSSSSNNEEILEVNYEEIIPFDNPEKLKSKEEPPMKNQVYTHKRNVSLPDLSKAPNVSYKDSALLRVFVYLYDLVDDKIDFFKKYLREVSRRVLLYEVNYYKELEIFTLLTCEDRDLKLKGEIMFSEMKDFTSTKSGIILLTESAWALDIENINIKIPDIFTDKMKNVEKSRVNWAWEYSVVVIELGDKEFRLNFLQYIIINLFNNYKFITKLIIKNETGMTQSLLEITVKSLITSKLLISENDKFILNCKAETTNVVDYFIKEDLNKEHEIDKEMYYLCKISNTMKKYKNMSESDTLKTIKEMHTDKFIFSNDDFSNSVKILIEKGIIEKCEGSLKYIP
ncbi:cullin-like [Vairimorpha necatrix]|uniref:Cullin-like n=1 Tax=Vairimorpha necatrix TaxID=6039 RepID=A0AAX4JAW1_9MICR